jgi:phenylacetaldehyde dehydrogenase|tara:strand:+ start:3669 stop:5174 length:1506 start_codon:yes stop_codon:yes gene_type:complete
MSELLNDYSVLKPEVKAFLEKEHELWIDGEWTATRCGATAPVYDPASGEEIGRIAMAGAADIDAAVQAAKKAFEGSWRATSPQERELLMLRLADLIEQHAEELGQLDTLDNGMPEFVATNLNVRGAAGVMRHMAGWASKIYGKTTDVVSPFPDTEFTGYTLKEPVGVVGAIVPWNVPMMVTVWKLAPALATGCTVVIKPSEDTSLSALRLAELTKEAGIPDGVVNVVTGTGSEAGEALVAHPDVQKISFTGSTAVGKHINRVATESLKNVTLELGGKSPNIIFNDANMQDAIPGSAMAIYLNTGQICVSGSRLYIQRGVFNEVVDGIAKFAESLKLGAGLRAGSQLGPMATRAQRERVYQYVQSGSTEGAEVVTGGKPLDAPGFYMQPTLLTGTNHSMSVVREEIFGPVLVAMPFDTLEEAVELANDTSYGLSAYVWSQNISTAHTMVRRINAGKVMVNNEGFPHPALPEGGFKQSGFGKDLGYESIEGCLRTKSVIMRTR